MLLAIDTSTKQIGLALYDEGGPLGECAWVAGNNQGSQLLPQLDMLMAHVGRGREALVAVGVALGPGSWSGLRVGVSVAKGIALAGGLPLLGVGTLDALAFQHKRPATPVFPLIALGRERFATAEFQHRGQWRRVSDYRNTTLDELAAAAEDRALFCGDIVPAVQERLRALLGERALFASPASNLRRPGYLAALAWERFREGAADSLDALEPIYLGDAVQGR